MDTSGDWIVKKGAEYWNYGADNGTANGRWLPNCAAILTHAQAKEIADALPFPVQQLSVQLIHIPGTK